MRYFMIVLISLFFIGPQAFARKGNDHARQLCSKLSKNKKRIKCVSLTDTMFFDKEAVKTCSTMISPKVMLDCLTVIAGFKYRNLASVGNCTMRKTDSRKYRCLSRIKDRRARKYRGSSNVALGQESVNAAFQLCDSHLRNSDKTACMRIVRGKKFDLGAVSVCRNLTYTSDKNKCLNIIGNQQYSVSEVAICKKMTFTADKLKCLGHDNSSIQSTGLSGNSEYDQALNVCANFMYASDKNNCLTKVRGKKFSAGTVSVCQELLYVADKLKCLETIANKKYHETELKVCSGMAYTSEKLKCLQGASASLKEKRKRTPEELLEDALGFLRSGKKKRAKKLVKKALSRM